MTLKAWFQDVTSKLKLIASLRRERDELVKQHVARIMKDEGVGEGEARKRFRKWKNSGFSPEP